MIKHKLATLDYAVDWSQWLVGGDTIVDSLWIVPNGLVIDPEHPPVHSGTVAKVWIKGGVPGKQYVITNRIKTASGLTDARDRDIYVPPTV